jgi:hypothetical protein
MHVSFLDAVLIYLEPTVTRIGVLVGGVLGSPLSPEQA